MKKAKEATKVFHHISSGNVFFFQNHGVMFFRFNIISVYLFFRVRMKKEKHSLQGKIWVFW